MRMRKSGLSLSPVQEVRHVLCEWKDVEKRPMHNIPSLSIHLRTGESFTSGTEVVQMSFRLIPRNA